MFQMTQVFTIVVVTIVLDKLKYKQTLPTRWNWDLPNARTNVRLVGLNSKHGPFEKTPRLQWRIYHLGYHESPMLPKTVIVFDATKMLEAVVATHRKPRDFTIHRSFVSWGGVGISLDSKNI